MSSYLGDFLDGATVRKMWNTNAVAGESIDRDTNGTISVYKDGGATQSTAGVTDTEAFATLDGVHLCAIDTSADAFYTPGSDYEVVLSGATIDGKAINATLFSFSLRNRSNATIYDRGLVAASGSATGTRLRSALNYANDIFNGGLLSFVAGTGKGQSTSITDYANTNDQVTHPTIAAAADTTTMYEVLPYGLVAPTASSPAAASVVQVNGDATAAANLAKTTRAIGRGTVGSSASTTSIPTSAFAPAGGAADQFKGRIITFDADTATAALRGQATDITANSNAATPTLTVTALTTPPASGDTFSVT